MTILVNTSVAKFQEFNYVSAKTALLEMGLLRNLR